MVMAIKASSQNQSEECVNPKKRPPKRVNRTIISKAIKMYPKYLTAFIMYSNILLNGFKCFVFSLKTEIKTTSRRSF